MLTYLSSPRHMPHSSSPLNPNPHHSHAHAAQRSSSPPLSSPTPIKSSLPRFNNGSSPGPSRPRVPAFPLSPRYQRTTPASSLAARRPRPSSSAPSSPDVFGDGGTPTQTAMWRDRLQRRMADRERRKAARDTDLLRRRGMEDYDDEEAERQAQADDEEIFRRLMVLQRRREQHSLARYDGEGVEFWADELDALSAEETALCAQLEGMDTDADAADQEMWAREAAEAEAAEAAAEEEEAAMNCYDGGIETAHGYGSQHWEDMVWRAEDWAKLDAVEAAVEDEAMDVEQ